MPSLLYTSNVHIVREGARLVVRRRASWTFGAATMGGVAAALFFGTSLVAAHLQPALAAFCRFIGAIVTFVSTLLLLKAAVISFFERPTVLDSSARTLGVGRELHPFDRIVSVYIHKTALSGIELLALHVDLGTRTLVLAEAIPLEHEPAMRHIVDEITSMVGAATISEAGLPIVALDVATSASTTRHFTTSFFVLFGALWSLVGYLFMLDVVLTQPGATRGLLLWPLGIFIVPLGVIGQTKLAANITRGPRWKLALALLVYLAPYIAVAIRPTS